jgi:hypothetical protein
MTALAHEPSVRGAIDVREAFIDASFAPATKGDAKSEKRNAAREQRSWRSLRMVVPEAPQNLIGDNAYDSDRLDAELRFYGMKSLLHIVETEGIQLKMDVG